MSSWRHSSIVFVTLFCFLTGLMSAGQCGLCQNAINAFVYDIRKDENVLDAGQKTIKLNETKTQMAEQRFDVQYCCLTTRRFRFQ